MSSLANMQAGSARFVCFPNERLWDDYGLTRLVRTTKGLPRVKT